MGGPPRRPRERMVRALGGEPGRRAAHPLDPHRRRPRRPRLGASVPPGRTASPVPVDRMDAGLVRRIPRLPLLHGGADAASSGRERRVGHSVAGRGAARPAGRRGGGPPTSPAGLAGTTGPAGSAGGARGAGPLRDGHQVGHRGRFGGHAGGRVGHRSTGRAPVPGSCAHLGCHPPVPVRPVVQHHGREPDVDHGRRVRLCPRHGGLPRVPGPPSSGHGDRSGSRSGSRRTCVDRTVPSVGGVLRPGCVVGCLRFAAQSTGPAVVGDHRSGSWALRGILDPAVLVASGPSQRHGVAQAHPLPVVSLGPG